MIDELVRGPNVHDDPIGPLTVVDSKFSGITPGLAMQRRDQIVGHYFAQLNPLDGFHIDGSMLRFENLGESAGLASVDAYEYEWFAFDNDTRGLTSGKSGATGQAAVRLPEGAGRAPDTFWMVRIRTRAAGVANWYRAVDVFLSGGATPRAVGIDRETESQ